MNTLDNFNMMNMVEDERKDKIVFHIPHSSIAIPSYTGFKTKELANELLLQTDFAVEHIFNVEGVDSIITNFSRLFCDVERYKNDENEEMSKAGRGAIYTHYDSGEVLRELSPEQKEFILINYYDDHHKKFEELVDSKINKYGECLIIDCHSFNDVPLRTDLSQTDNRPDICIGYGAQITSEIYNKIFYYFKDLAFEVNTNSPYSDSIVPNKFYGNDDVQSVMIELNKKLYIDNNNRIDILKVIELNKIITNLINLI